MFALGTQPERRKLSGLAELKCLMSALPRVSDDALGPELRASLTCLGLEQR